MFPGSQGERGPIRQTQKFPVAAQKTTLAAKINSCGRKRPARSFVRHLFFSTLSGTLLGFFGDFFDLLRRS
jgi:hypothetical protein